MHELGIVFHIIDSLESVGRENHHPGGKCNPGNRGSLRRSGFLFKKTGWKWASEKSSPLLGSQTDHPGDSSSDILRGLPSDLWNGGARKGMSILLRWKYISGGRKRI